MTMSRLANVYARDHDYIIQSSSLTTMGVRIGTKPIEVLNGDAAASDLGVAVQKALAASTEGVAHPTDWKAILQPILQCAKVRSWNALQKSAKTCHVETLDRELRIVPSRNGGTSGPDKGYHPIQDQAVVLPHDCSDEELGCAVLQAVALCR